MLNETCHLYKIILIGDSSVGKSSLMSRYTDNYYSDHFMSTIGVDFKIKCITHNGETIKFQIWDTAGQEKFRAITTSYYRGIHCYIIAFGLDDLNTFYNVRNYIQNIEKFGNKNVLIILIGTKSDIKKNQITSDMITELIGSDIKYFETSAKYNKNINELFEYIATELLHKNIKKVSTPLNNNIKVNQINDTQQNHCCF
jgi:Ras-related protein Rab-1A